MGFLISFAFFVASYIFQALTQPKTTVQNAKPAIFSDFNIPQVDEGTPQIVVFGDCWLEDWTVLHTGAFKSEAIRKKAGGGGKK